MFKILIFISAFFTSGIVLIHEFYVEKDHISYSSNKLNADPAANYKNYCSSCHGELMEAFVDRKWKYGSDKKSLVHAINIGYPNDGMPGFDTAFTDKEVDELADYILEGLKNVQRFDFAKQPQQQTSYSGEGMNIQLETVIGGLKSPWGLAFLPNDDILFTEKTGQLYRYSKSKKLNKISGVPEVIAEGQGGLMDVILHPDFKKNKTIYLSYSKPKEEGGKTLATTAIMSAVLENDELSQQKIIFEAYPYSQTRHHYGSRMVFGNDGMLYFSVGDRGNHNQYPQDLQYDPGKIHRIKDDGTVPADNPFVNTANARKTIYSYGHRNPQGLVKHPETGEIWSHEHGPRGGDEINLVQKGKNYGWPVISYGINYNGTTFTDKTSMPGMEQPLLYWIPSIGPSGMTIVNSNKYRKWKGNILSGSLRFKYLNLSSLDGHKVTDKAILFENIGRLRDVKMGNDGYIYISVENPGSIYRLQPK